MKNTALAAAVGALAATLVADSGPGSAGGRLTDEQLRLLSHMELVRLDDGTGNALPTIRFSGVNVQLVHGAEEFDQVNGLGNLIIGFERSAYPFPRTGSHNLVVGEGNSWTSHGGVVVGSACRLEAPQSAILASTLSSVDGSGAHVVLNSIDSHVLSGDGHTIQGSEGNVIEDGQSNTMLGGLGNRIEGGYQNVLVGGTNNRTDPSTTRCEIIGGTDIDLVDSVKVVALSGNGNTALHANGGALVAGAGNHLRAAGACVIGGAGNEALGFASVVGGGRDRRALGEFDWVAGSLFEDE